MPEAGPDPHPGDGPPAATGGESRPSWTILTNHGHVLLAVAAHPDILVEDLALRVGITRRAALHILKDLEEAGYIHRLKEGRRTHYVVEGSQPFRHPAESHHDVGALLRIFKDDEVASDSKRPSGR
ncbi:hypothetical protein GCM10009784_10820 [Arthrobacter parietis]|uniref:Winged helix-turn-helix domain-containing protein n=2 Tax=Arthrobacter TaxID=1663 RepID=A0ABT6CWT8_9MICC|nr:winged helix-turn-helix domain-containing protein [Arthrobacter vasquezii]MDF9278556.1 winged helix-turn-helix domain-containing protein [Arthrobacter vasquezii]